MACDLNKGVSYGRQRRFKGICLNDNVPTMMAYSNDVCYEAIFVGPLKNFLQSGTVVVRLFGSGNSENVIRAIDYANEKGALTVGLCSYSGGRLKQKAQVVVHMDVNDMQMTVEGHELCAWQHGEARPLLPPLTRSPVTRLSCSG